MGHGGIRRYDITADRDSQVAPHRWNRLAGLPDGHGHLCALRRVGSCIPGISGYGDSRWRTDSVCGARGSENFAEPGAGLAADWVSNVNELPSLVRSDFVSRH